MHVSPHCVLGPNIVEVDYLFPHFEWNLYLDVEPPQMNSRQFDSDRCAEWAHLFLSKLDEFVLAQTRVAHSRDVFLSLLQVILTPENRLLLPPKNQLFLVYLSILMKTQRQLLLPIG